MPAYPREIDQSHALAGGSSGNFLRFQTALFSADNSDGTHRHLHCGAVGQAFSTGGEGFFGASGIAGSHIGSTEAKERPPRLPRTPPVPPPSPHHNAVHYTARLPFTSQHYPSPHA